MPTDTAFALGLLALVARGLPDRVRIFLLTVVVVDDLVALLVIATVYSGPVLPRSLVLAIGLLGGILLLRLARIRFTVSLLIASLAFHGPELQEAKLGILSAALLASLLAWMVFAHTARLSPARRTRALLGTAETLIDLAVPVEEDRDHLRGPADARVTLVEYGDFECPYCGQAEPVVRALLANFGDLRYVWRHLPLTDVHPNAALSAEVAEAADRQGAFWPMHDLLLQHQQELRPVHLVR